MKKVLMSLLLLSFSSFVFSRSFDQLRQDFKQQLYQRQEGLMEQRKYEAFIEPFIKEAENKLQIPQYFSKNPNSPGIKDYFDCLLNYNVAWFHDHLTPNLSASNSLKTRGRDLYSIIEQIKNNEQLSNLDVQEEYKKTVALFLKVNKIYCKNLGFKTRSLLKLSNIFS